MTKTPEQKWSFKRNFQYKGTLSAIRTRINQMLQDNNKNKFIRPTLTGVEIKTLCEIQDRLNNIIQNYNKRTHLLKIN